MTVKASGITAHFDSWKGGSRPTESNPVTLHFCPEMRRGLFLISDHGDRTKVAVSQALYFGHSDPSHPDFNKLGIVPAGVRVTQSVLCSGWPGFEYLENPQFMELMKRAYAGGTEVCPHNTSEHMGLPPGETRRNIGLIAENFGLTTWIDHFRIPSNLSQQGMNPASPYFILDKFKGYGGRIAWSFIDRFANPPAGEIDLLAPPSFASYAKKFLMDSFNAARKRKVSRRARASVGAFVLQSVGAGVVGNLGMLRKNPRRIGLRHWITNVVSLPSNLARHWLGRVGGANTDFPVRWDAANALYWFDTARILFISECYNRRSLDALVQNAGVHLGHTYIGFHGAKYDDCAFEAQADGGYAIGLAFQDFLNDLSTASRSGQIWNPTVRELSQYFDLLSHVRFEHNEATWRVSNTGSEKVTVTIRSVAELHIEGASPAGQRKDHDGMWYAVELEPGGSADIRNKAG